MALTATVLAPKTTGKFVLRKLPGARDRLLVRQHAADRWDRGRAV